MTRPLLRYFFASLVLPLVLAGCGWFGDKLDAQKNWTVEQFYQNAREELESGNFAGAIKLYEALEARYPFGRYTQQAQLDVAYANYKDNETASAVAAADRFMKLHPNHPNLDYALYIKGLAYFKPDLGLFGQILNLDPAERDPKALRDSFDVFKELIARFPDSIYADDTRGRMVYLVNTLAKHDLSVARYYYNRGGYLAAVNRAQTVITRYPQAPVAEEALVITVESYEKLGMKDLADASRRVLQTNFPSNALVSTAPRATKSWWKLW
ncbi:MAG: outer membrane protein assembly factor BamD [Betaproteobacteria bacterium]|jgi:outer membrane protein assembly factor BamD|nr:competence protein ComL [Betaproteobacteria bacterium UKL13-2]HCG51985.1 outer membrane protein assembly factor BamD [Betaproteobacteria bacterium]